MLKTLKSKPIAILALTLVFTLMMCAMGITAFAHDDHEGGSADLTGFAKFWDSYNQLIGYIVAGVIFVVMVIFIIWWIPKDKAKAKKRK